MRFLDVYDIPEEVRRGQHSVAFGRFLHHWFAESTGLNRKEADLSFIGELTPQEAELAKDLLRRNLKLGYPHVIEGVAEMADTAAVAVLRVMLAEELDLSRQLTIAGTLWRLAGDTAFVDCLNRMKASEDSALKQAHFHQILWLRDQRAIDLLFELLDDNDHFVRYLALSALNELEFGRRLLVPEDQFPCRAAEYRKRRKDPVVRALLVNNLSARSRPAFR